MKGIQSKGKEHENLQVEKKYMMFKCNFFASLSKGLITKFIISGLASFSLFFSVFPFSIITEEILLYGCSSILIFLLCWIAVSCDHNELFRC